MRVESTALYSLTPLSILKVLREHSKSIAFFHTPEISIIGLNPKEVIKTEGQNPFALIQEMLSLHPQSPVDSLPFFQGGAMGYISYDAVRFLEPSLQQQGNTDAEVIFFNQFLIFDHIKRKTSIVRMESSLQEATEFEALIKKAESAITETASFKDVEEIPIEMMTSHLGKEGFLKSVVKLKHHIREGDIFQAVLSDRFTHPFGGDALRLFEILSIISPAPYQFFFSHEGRAYLGASPEMLLKSMGGRIETHPIAGTRPRGKDEQEEKRLEVELLANIKEKAEHLMLVDLARNDLGRVAEPGTVTVESFQKVKKFGGVMHLVSVVSAKLSSKLSALQALASCFPAGTLSGAPKIRAMDLIWEQEREPRGFYGGAFIAASFTGDLDSCISIRSISIQDGVARIQAGAGIVADSDPEMEYQEIKHKSKLTRKALAIALHEMKVNS